MPQIVVIAVGALTLYCAYRWFRAEARRVDAALRRTEGKLKCKFAVPPATSLALDVKTGMYQPVTAYQRLERRRAL